MRVVSDDTGKAVLYLGAAEIGYTYQPKSGRPRAERTCGNGVHDHTPPVQQKFGHVYFTESATAIAEELRHNERTKQRERKGKKRLMIMPRPLSELHQRRW